MYGTIVTEQLLIKQAQIRGVPFELYTNVKIEEATSGKQNELDLVFCLGDNIFCCEMKTGKLCTLEKYRDLLIRMGMIPDHMLLLSSEIQDDKVAQGIRYFYEYYVSNIDNFKNTLALMIS